jgi:hypothetical protein
MRVKQRSINKLELVMVSIGILIFLCVFRTHVLAKTSEDTKEIKESNNQLEIRWEAGLLSVKLKEAPIKEILQEISRLTGFELIIPQDTSKHISTSFSHLSLGKGLGVIMDKAGLNFITIYEGKEDYQEQPQSRTSKVIVLDSSDGNVTKTGPYKKPARPTSTRVRKKHDPQPHGNPLISQKTSIKSTPKTFRSKKGQTPPSGIFEGSQGDLDNYLVDLVNEERLSHDEYQMILEKIESKWKSQ